MNLLFTTVHPAPYIDKMLEYLKFEYTINVIYNRLSDKYKQWDNYTGIKGVEFKDLNIVSLIKLIRKADFIIVGGWASWDNIKLIFLSHILLKRVAVFSDCPISVNQQSAKYWFKRIFLFKCINYIFCATESTKSLYSKKYKLNERKLIVFPYAIHFPIKEEAALINQKRIRELVEMPAARIFISNSFYKRKGYDVLLQSFQELAKLELLNYFDITIAGAGEEFEYYKEMLICLSPKIKLVGWLNYDEYIDKMNNTDIFIHASIFEPFGIPPIDAMARGKILIVSDGVQSTSSIIKNGYNGYIYNATNAKQLTSIIRNLNTESFYQIGQNALKTAQENFNYEIYSRVLNTCLK